MKQVAYLDIHSITTPIAAWPTVPAHHMTKQTLSFHMQWHIAPTVNSRAPTAAKVTQHKIELTISMVVLQRTQSAFPIATCCAILAPHREAQNFTLAGNVHVSLGETTTTKGTSDTACNDTL